MEGVNDPEAFSNELKDQLLNNKDIKGIIQEGTIGQMLGHAELKKYVHR